MVSQKVFAAIAIIASISLIAIGNVGQRDTIIAVSSETSIYTNSWNATIRAYAQSGDYPARIDVISNGNTLSAFAGDSVSMLGRAKISSIGFNDTLQAYLARITIPIQESQLYNEELFTVPLQNLSYRITDGVSFSISLKHVEQGIHVFGNGNEFVAIGDIYLPMPVYSLLVTNHNGLVTVSIVGANTLWRDVSISVVKIL